MGCSEGYNYRTYNGTFPGLQSQGREQVHSQLEKITTSLRQLLDSPVLSDYLLEPVAVDQYRVEMKQGEQAPDSEEEINLL